MHGWSDALGSRLNGYQSVWICFKTEVVRKIDLSFGEKKLLTNIVSSPHSKVHDFFKNMHVGEHIHVSQALHKKAPKNRSVLMHGSKQVKGVTFQYQTRTLLGLVGCRVKVG